MALRGDAFLAIWHDIVPSSWSEYTEWHTREHMPERLSIPGFTIGKRLINHDLERYRYGTIYAGDSIEVFHSPAYLERLNHPTQWSNSMQPAFRNFIRIACARIVSDGVGDGGAMATLQLDFAEDGNETLLRSRADKIAKVLLAIRGVCAVHIGIARPEVSAVKTRESELRPKMKEQGFDAVVLVEGSGRPELEAIVQDIEAAIAESDCGLKNPRTLVYNLAYQLTGEQMRGGGDT